MRPIENNCMTVFFVLSIALQFCIHWVFAVVLWQHDNEDRKDLWKYLFESRPNGEPEEMLLTFQLCPFDVAFHRIQHWPQCTIPEWNSLPEAVATAPSLTSFEFRDTLSSSPAYYKFIMFISLWFACNIEYSARVVKWLGLCRWGPAPGSASLTGLA